jgi:hypothetical protein
MPDVPFFVSNDINNAEQEERDRQSRQNAMLLAAVYARDTELPAGEFVELIDMLGLDEELLGAIKLRRPKLVAIVDDVRAVAIEAAAGSTRPDGR